MATDPEIELMIVKANREASFNDKQVNIIKRTVKESFYEILQPYIVKQERHSTALFMMGMSLIILIPAVVTIYVNK